MVSQGTSTPTRESATSDEIWDCYNTLLLSPDRARLRKLLVRYRLFERVVDVPGDVVECGVYKGAGLLYWAKLIELFAPASRKRAIGFDVFAPFSGVELRPEEKEIALRHDELILDTSRSAVEGFILRAGLEDRVVLLEGDVTVTAQRYAEEQRGARISLLNLDLDTYAGTSAALRAFWPLLSPGAVIVLDEYGISGMGESDAADEFFAEHGLRPSAVPFAETPTAYLVKP